MCQSLVRSAFQEMCSPKESVAVRDGEHKAASRQSIIPPQFLSYSPRILCQEWKVAGRGSVRRWDRNAGPGTAVFVLVTQCAAGGGESCRNTCSLHVVQAFLIFKGLVCRLVASVNICGCQTRSEARINVRSGWEDKKKTKKNKNKGENMCFALELKSKRGSLKQESSLIISCSCNNI